MLNSNNFQLGIGKTNLKNSKSFLQYNLYNLIHSNMFPISIDMSLLQNCKTDHQDRPNIRILSKFVEKDIDMLQQYYSNIFLLHIIIYTLFHSNIDYLNRLYKFENLSMYLLDMMINKYQQNKSNSLDINYINCHLQSSKYMIKIECL